VSYNFTKDELGSSKMSQSAAADAMVARIYTLDTITQSISWLGKTSANRELATSLNPKDSTY